MEGCPCPSESRSGAGRTLNRFTGSELGNTALSVQRETASTAVLRIICRRPFPASCGNVTKRRMKANATELIH
jgi:hypothetical protein